MAAMADETAIIGDKSQVTGNNTFPRKTIRYCTAALFSIELQLLLRCHTAALPRYFTL